ARVTTGAGRTRAPIATSIAAATLLGRRRRPAATATAGPWSAAPTRPRRVAAATAGARGETPAGRTVRTRRETARRSRTGRATGPARGGLVHADHPTVQAGAVQRADGALGLLLAGHLHEPESSRPADFPIGHDRRRLDGPEARE